MQPWRGTGEQPDVKNHIVSDAVDQYLIYHMVAAQSYAKEGWLGWSSLTYGGTAQYANTMALYYDWTLQLHRWFDFWTAWHLGIMIQVMLAAVGMFLFLRGRSIVALWACCGALAYAANSQFVTWIYHRWTLGSFCWVPWILWAIDAYRKDKRGFWPLVPIFIALAFLGGTLQHSAYVVLAVIAIWGEEAVRTGRAWIAQARLLGRYTSWGLLGFGLAGMMFLPCIDAFITSTRLGLHMGMHGTSAMGLYPKGVLQPILNLFAYPLQIFPSVLGRSDTVDLQKVFRNELFYIIYFGSLPVLIAFLALFRKRAPLLARLLIGMGLLLPLTPLLRLLYHRLYLLFILGGIFAFVHFMQTASFETRKLIFKVTASAAAVAIAAWICLSGLMTVKAATVKAFLNQKIVETSGGSFGYFRDWIQARADRFTGDLFIWSPQQLIPLTLFLVALVGLRLTAARESQVRNRGAWLIVLAVVLEVSVFGSRWITYVDGTKAPLFAATPETVVLQEKVGRAGRITTMIEETGSHMAVTPFIPNTLSPYGIATIHGYDSIMPNGMLLVNDPTRDPLALGRIGVTHLITYPENQAVGRDWKLVWQSPVMALYKNPMAVPHYVGFRDREDMESFFQGGTAREWTLLTETTQMENTREVETPAEVRWIRVAENQASGWEFKTTTAAQWLPVQRAPDKSMLIPLPEGETTMTVAMRYNPPMRRLGFYLSIISVLMTTFGAFWVRRKWSHADESLDRGKVAII